MEVSFRDLTHVVCHVHRLTSLLCYDGTDAYIPCYARYDIMQPFPVLWRPVTCFTCTQPSPALVGPYLHMLAVCGEVQHIHPAQIK